MFDSKHYIPILKWKRAEQGALRALSENQKKCITPLIQFVMPKYKPGKNLKDENLKNIVAKFEEQLPQIPEKIIETWGTTPVFIDVSLLFTTHLKAKSIKEISLGGQKPKGIFIPVIHLNDDQEIQDAAYSVVKKTKSGICLRLICPDFSNLTKLNQNINNLLSSSKLTEKEIDLMVDIKETGDNGDKYVQYFNSSQNFPNITKWRTFIFASGSFPEDLSQCKIDEENLIPRIGWKSWKEQVKNKKLQRKPSFSDYTIQHPVYKEVSQFFNPTCSIKYTLENEWLIMKGERQKFAQYLASAAELKKSSKYYGKDFSDGDRYIEDRANHFLVYLNKPSVKGTGSTETWLRAGINHHLVLVANQVANLF